MNLPGASSENPARDKRAYALSQVPVAAAASVDEARASERSAAARAYLARRAWLNTLWVLIGIAATAVGAVLIGAHPDSGPALFAVQLLLILCGPLAILAGLFRLTSLLLRRRSVRLRAWRCFPARAASLGVGPFRLTVVGLEVGGTTLVIFPEQILRSRVRRLIEREHELLMLMPRRGRLGIRLLYAGAAGAPVFGDYSAMAMGPYWERHGLAALDRADRAGGTDPAAGRADRAAGR